MITKRHPKILFLTNHPIEDGSSRYRIYQFLPELEKAEFQCTVRPFTTSRLFSHIRNRKNSRNSIEKALHIAICSFRRILHLSTIASYDLVIIHREAFPFFMPLVETVVLKLSRKVVFSFDDAIYAGHGEEQNLLYRMKYGPGVNQVLEKCAHVIAGNKTLAEYAKQFNQNVTIVPTVVDLDRYSYKLSEGGRTDGTITIGWFGSNSTSPYLVLVVSALLRLSKKHGQRLRFCFYGDPDLNLGLPNSTIKTFRLSTEIDDLRNIDIGIMPAPTTTWTRGKCSFKAIQYMALGIPTVVSPVGMAAELVEDGVNGFHANNEEEWFDKLDRLVGDVKLRERLSKAGRLTIENEYSLQVWAPRFIGLVKDLVHDSSTVRSGIEAREI